MNPAETSLSRRLEARGRRGKAALTAVAALAVIAAAGLAIYSQINEGVVHPSPPPEVSKSPPTARAKPDADSLDGAALHTRLVVLRPGNGKDAKSVVSLGKVTGTDDPAVMENTLQSILARELFRQALLISARDELGLATRDEVIGDSAPAARRGDAPVELVINFRPGACWVVIRRGEGGHAETLFKRVLGNNPDNNTFLPQILPLAEELSRGEFAKVLNGLGLKGRPNDFKPDAGLPEGVERRLSGLEFTETLSAVRDVHKAIRADGESPARLTALVRGYAHLGVLSEFQWHPAHKAFKARSLLYAQRLLAREPKSPRGVWSKAYAMALAGRQRLALVALERAKKLSSAGGKNAQPAPDWVGLIDAYSKFDRDRLRVKDGPLAGLAALLRMFIDEYPLSTALSLRAAKDVLALDPECFRAHDALCQFRGVSNLHVATEVAPQVLTRLFPAKLGALDGLPQGVRDRLGRRADEVALVDSLRRAGEPGDDDGEPSWAVLGHLVRETRFVQVWRRLHFMTVVWAVPAGEYWAEARPLVAGHRYLPYLEAMAASPPQSTRAFEALAAGLDVTDVETKQVDMILFMGNDKSPRAKFAWSAAVKHCDMVALDSEQLVAFGNEGDQAHLARVLTSFTDLSPFGIATLIDKNWDYAQTMVASWRKRLGDNPTMLGALGKRYTQLGRVDEAQELLTRYIKASPDFWAYELLAANYKAKGDLRRWQETLDEFLSDVEDPGLFHAKARVEIARHYMSQGQWQRARPYAEAAGETWAGWAMECAAECAEGMGDWEGAEAWVRRTAERYPNTSWHQWLLFCKRTGHGDAGAAQDFADQYLASVADRPDAAGPEALGFYYWLAGEPRKALASFRKAYGQQNSAVGAGFGLALVADDLGEATLRDETFKDLCERSKDKAPRSIEVCQMFREAIARGDKPPLDLAAVDRVIAAIAPQRRGNTEFFVGRFLKNHGKPADARAYLARASKSVGTLFWMKTIAIDTLKNLGPG